MVRKKGFTLVELAVVLIIIGLLIGIILVATSLISSSKVQALTKQLTEFDTATDAFMEKYGRLPGDTSKVVCPDPNVALGDNNGILQTSDVFEFDGESGCFWPELSINGLKPEGSSALRYYGNAVTASFPYGTNMPNAPQSKLGRNAGILAQGGTSATGGTVGNILGGGNKPVNFFFIADCTGGGYSASCTNGIAGADAIAIDKKMDDGIATGGNVVGFQIGSSALSHYNDVIDTPVAAYPTNDDTPGPSKGTVLVIRMGITGASLR